MGVFLLCLHLALKPMESQLVTPTVLLASLIAAVQVKRSLLRFGIMVTKDLILTWRMHMVLKKAHYEVIMNDKILSLIEEAETHYQEL